MLAARRGAAGGLAPSSATEAARGNLAGAFSAGLGAPASSCQDAADADDDGRLNITDVVYSLSYQFLGTPPPPAPGPGACGADPTADALPECGYDASRC